VRCVTTALAMPRAGRRVCWYNVLEGSLPMERCWMPSCPHDAATFVRRGNIDDVVWCGAVWWMD
jgi:hypothetical protein